MDAELLRAFSALPKAKKKSRPEDLKTHQVLDRESRIFMLKNGLDGTDYFIESHEFIPLPGQTLTECLQEDPTWLIYYRRTKDAEHA